VLSAYFALGNLFAGRITQMKIFHHAVQIEIDEACAPKDASDAAIMR